MTETRLFLRRYEPCPHCGSIFRPGASTCPVCGPYAHGRSSPTAEYEGGNPAFAESFDARDWAEAFCERFLIFRRKDGGAMDAGLMVGWFANAIMRGWDEHARRYPHADDLPSTVRSEP